MKKEDKKPNDAASLRKKAEEQLEKKNSLKTANRSTADSLKLLHELEVQQIELEMQNEELRLAKEKAETATQKFISLYDFAPIAYFSLNREGIICKLNFSGARMLGKERSSIVNKNFRQFLTSDTLSVFNDFSRNIFDFHSKETCEIEIKTGENSAIYAHLEGIISEDDQECLVSAFDITDQKQAEEKIRDNEEKFRTLFERMPSGAAVYEVIDDGKDFIIKDFNSAAEEIEKIERKLLIGKRVAEVFPGAREFGILDVLNRVWKTGEVEFFPESIYRDERDPGSWRESWVYKLPSGDVVAIYNDVTERKKAENELKERNHFIQTVLDRLPIGLAVNSVDDGKVSYMNSKFESIYGWPKERLYDIDSLFSNVYPNPEYREEIRNRVLSDIQSGDPDRMRWDDVTVTGEDGTTKIISAMNIPMFEQNQMISLVQDITKLKKTERKFQESEERYRLLYQVAGIGVGYYTTDGKIITLNEMALKLIGKSASDVEGKSLYDVFPKENAAVYTERILGVLETEKESFEDEVVLSGEKIWFLSVYSTVKNSAGDILGVQIMSMDITERKKAEEELIEANQVTEGIINAIPARVFWKDKNLNYLGCNKIFANDAGYNNPQEIIGKDDYQMAWGEQADLYRNDDRKVMETGQPQLLIEEPQTTPDGKTLTLLTSKIPMRDSLGEIIGVLGVYLDITERKQAEEQIRFQANLLKAIEQAVIVSDPDGHINYWNPYAEQMYGWSAEEVIGKTVFDVTVPHLNQEQAAEIMKQLNAGQSWSGEFYVKHRNGNTFPVFANDTPILNENGEIVAIIGISMDITKRKRAEEALVESEKQFKFIIKHDPNAIAVYNNDLRYIMVSDRYLTDYNVKDEDIIGKHHYEVFPEIPQRWRDVHQRVLAGAIEKSDEDFFVRPDGSITWNKWECRPWYDGDGNIGGMITYTEVITERKEAEIALRESQKQFELAMDASQDGLYDWDLLTNEIYYSPGYKRILGYEPEELPNDFSVWEKLTSPEDVKRSWEMQQELINKKRDRFELEFKMKHKDGHWVDILSRANAIFDDDGKAIKIVGTHVNISKLKYIERLIDAERNRIQQYLDIAGVMIAVIDKHGNITQINEKGCEILGYKENEVLGQNWFDLCITKENRQEIIDVHSKVFSGETEPFEFYENEIITKSGELKVIAFHNSIVHDENNNITGVLFSGDDVTENRRMNDLVRENEDFLATVFENIPEMLFVKDPKELRFIKFNKAGEELLGYKRDELIGKNDYDFFTKEQADFFTNNDKEVIRSKKLLDIPEEEIETRHLGKRILHTIKIPIFDKDDNPRFLLGISEDITERKLAEKALSESEEKFRTIFNESPIGIEIYNADGTQLTANKASLNMFGILDVSEIETFNLFDGISLDDEKKETLRRGESIRYQAIFDFDKVKELQLYETIKNGSAYFYYIITPLTNYDTQTIQGYLLQVQDITERIIGENALRSSERKLNTLVNNLPGMAYRSLDDENYTMKFLSKGCEELTGYKPDELIDNKRVKFSDIIHPDDRKFIAAEIKRSVNEGQPFEINYRIITKSGEVKWVWERGQKLEDDLEAGTFLEGIIEDITQKIESKEKLKESEEKYRSMFENMLNGFAFHKIVTDDNVHPVDYIFLEVNNGFETMTGLKKNDIIGRRVTEVLPGIEDHPESWIERYGHVALTGDDMHFEDYSEQLDKWYSVYAYCPRKGYFVTLVEDITEKKKVEKEIQKLSYSVEQSPIAVLITDVRGNIEYVNRSFTSLTGFINEDVVGKNPRIFQSGETPAEDYSRLWETVLNGGEWSGEFHNRKKNGELYWEFAIISGIKDPEGKIIHLVAFKEDITERKKTEEALIESEAKWRSLTENSADYILLLDTGTNIQFVNRGIPGISKEESVGKNAYYFIPKPFYNVAKNCFDKVLSTGESASFETEYHPEGNKLEYFSVRVGPVFKSGKVAALVLGATNITKRKTIENSLKNSYARLRSLTERLQIVREEERASVAREIHDDLGQSLTALKMDISWLRKNPEIDEPTRAQKFDMILDLTNSTIKTVKKIASDLRPGILDDLGLVPAIEWLTGDFQDRYKIKCNLNINEKDVSMKENISIAVYRIYQETLTNIARHSKATRVDIHLDFQANRKLFMEIHDNGIGIDNETSKSQKSFGILGMKERVSLLKGGLQIIGKPESGTMVRVVIPY